MPAPLLREAVILSMPSLPSNQVLYTLGFLACCGLIAVAMYFQFVLLYEPCPLCILQRLGFIAVGLICLVAAIHNPAAFGNRVYGALVSLAGMTGLGIAIRHIWLQHNPPAIAECGPGVDYWLDTLPVGEVIRRMFTGTGDCTEILWQFLGLSIPAWSALMFLGFTGFGLRQLLYRHRVRS